MRKLPFAIACFSICLLLLPDTAVSQWTSTTDPYRVLIAGPGDPRGIGFQTKVDKDGSVFFLSEYYNELHCVKFDKDGYELFRTVVSSNPKSHFELSLEYGGGCDLVCDGEGGAIVIWIDYRNSDTARYWPFYRNNAIRGQRVRSDGSLSWNGAEGIVIADETSGMKSFWSSSPWYNLFSDGNSGAFLYWFGFRNEKGGSFYDRLLPDGSLQFGQGGQPLCPLPGDTLFQSGYIMGVDSATARIHVFAEGYPSPTGTKNRYLVYDPGGARLQEFLFDSTSWPWRMKNRLWIAKSKRDSSSTSNATEIDLAGVLPAMEWDTTWTYEPDRLMAHYTEENSSLAAFTKSGMFHLLKESHISHNVRIPELAEVGALLAGTEAFFAFSNTITDCIRFDEYGRQLWPRLLRILDDIPLPDYQLRPDMTGGFFLIFSIGDSTVRIQHIGYSGTIGITRTDVPVSQAGNRIDASWNVYPHPVGSHKFFSIRFDSEKDRSPSILQIFDALGREMLRQEITVGRGINIQTIDTSSLPGGMYQYRISDGIGKPFGVGVFIK